MARNVTGIFPDRGSAEQAIKGLMDAGFAPDDISALMPHGAPGREFAVREKSKAPEGAAVGAATGGALGALGLGLVAAGNLAAPGLGLLVAGPLVAALAGAGAGGAAGGIVGALVGAGIPEHEAKLYSERIEDGGTLVGVKVHEDRAERARAILEAAGGRHLHD